MYKKASLEDIRERCERVVDSRTQCHTLDLEYRRLIADKFANKSLKELNEIVSKLDRSNV